MCGFKSWTVLMAVTQCLLVGCSAEGPPVPEVAAVTGTVTLDGQALVGAAVTFSHSSGASGVGVTDGQGHYELVSYYGPRTEAKGVVPLEYQVTVSKFVPPKGMTQEEYQAKVDAANKISATGAVPSPAQQAPPLQLLLPPQYSAPGKTVLKATVLDQGKNQFDFQLKGSASA